MQTASDLRRISAQHACLAEPAVVQQYLMFTLRTCTDAAYHGFTKIQLDISKVSREVWLAVRCCLSDLGFFIAETQSRRAVDISW